MQPVFIDGTVWFPDAGLLVCADLHLGYEAELRARGVYVPSSEFSVLHPRFAGILAQVRPTHIVVNGDFKHSFGRISDEEWRHAGQLLDLLLHHAPVTLVSGNHDLLLGPLARKRGLAVKPFIDVCGVRCMHGDVLPEGALPDVHTVVIGHVHPAVRITRGARSELVKCYLVGVWRNKTLLVLPSMFSLVEGTDVLDGQYRSPFLSDVRDFAVHVLSEGQVLPFGTVRDVERLAKG